MKTDEVLGQLLDRDWTEADLRLAAQLLKEVEATPETLEAMRRNDRVRELLRNPTPDAAPARGWEQFERESHTPGPGRVVGTFQPANSVQWTARSTGLLRVAVVLIAATGWLLYFLRPVSHDVPAPNTTAGTHAPRNQGAVKEASFAKMTPGEVAQQVGLFGNVASVFDKRAKWVAVSGATAEMGLAATPMPAKGRLILLRLAVLKSGKLLSKSDLAILPGQDADVALPLEGDQHVRYHISATTSQPTRLSLWAELQKPGAEGQTLAALATELSAKPGDLIKAGELTTSSGQYQFQLGFFEASQEVSR